MEEDVLPLTAEDTGCEGVHGTWLFLRHVRAHNRVDPGAKRARAGPRPSVDRNEAANDSPTTFNHPIKLCL